MSEVTLHGQPVKVGDKVWHAKHGYSEVLNVVRGDKYPIVVKGMGAYSVDGESGLIGLSLYWQPINPAAIEAAKVKPMQPVYEWQWLYRNVHGRFSTTSFLQSEEEAANRIKHLNPENTLVCRIDESKREVAV